MVRSKQTLRKAGMNYNAAGAHRQGELARFPGKPTGKAGAQLAAMSQDGTNDSSSSSSSEEGENSQNRSPAPRRGVLQNAINVGRRRRGVGGKARILTRKPRDPNSTRRHYRYKPGVWALKEISFLPKGVWINLF